MTLSTRRISAVALVVAASVGLAACGSSSSSSSSGSGSSSSGSGTSSSGSSGGSASISGAGSTLAAPIYQQWGSNLKGQGLTVNYNPVGSGAGIAQLQAGTVDFAGSDPPEKPAEITAGKGTVAMFPTAFGGITVSYNLAGVRSGLKLDGKTIADIYLGKIKTWSHPEIKALNPGVKLPSSSITVVHRSDASGTTKGFATFLSDYNPAWTAAAGKPDKTVKWPTGTGAQGNSGVAAAVKQTSGAIGYVEQAYALQNNFTYAAVKNSTGSYVLPTLAATSAAAVGIKVPANLAISTINSPNATAYPIVSQTFLIVYKDMCKAGVTQSAASGVKKFIAYGLGAGQAVEKQLSYGPPPSGLIAREQTQLNSLTCNGSPLS
ncbi:MAG: phosphate ABC transporter substrate-binding protein PstS [Solirubrobacterales bacterium]|nr:MAG: phosphate ABC transporter substrate-binding protein PstS [Solirubrobacterales bacterium]